MGFEYYDFDIEDIVDIYIEKAMKPRFKDAISREIYFDRRKGRVIIKFYFAGEEKEDA